MQYEGEHRQIVLRGIERAMANGVAQDGGVNEVINLIPRNGSLVPYAPKDVTDDCTPFLIDNGEKAKMVRVHHTSTGDNTIIVFEDHYYIINPTQGSQIPISKTVNNIVFIGNRMDLETSTGIEHWLWKNGEYVNNDDLSMNTGGPFPLPSVSFKVERGIYDGKQVYGSAQFVRIHKNYTDADTSNPNYEEAEKYVRNAGSMGSDAVSLLDSIRYAGGVTGYVLAAAAWRVKGGDVSNPKYIMASPVLLMGAPEIYMKDDKFEKKDNTYLVKPTYDSLLDMFNYQEQLEHTHETTPSAVFDKSFQDLVSDDLWEMSESDDRDIEDMAENEHVNIDMQEESTACVLRKDNVAHDKYELQTTALWSSKFALWRGGSDAEHRGIRITHGSANVLLYKLNREIDEQYKDEVDRLCIFISPIITPYKRIDTSGVRMDLFTKFPSTSSTLEPYNYYRFVDDSINGSQLNHSHVVCSSYTPIIKSEQEIRDEIKNVVGLYKVAEIQLNELTSDWVKVNLSEGRLATDRMVQSSDTMLKLSDLQPVGFTKGQIFGYNERLHVFNFQKNEVYRLPYESLYYYGGGGQYANEQFSTEIDYQIEITDSNGSITVFPFHDTKKMLNPLISCADIDAKQIRLVWKFPPQEMPDAPTIYQIGELIYKPIEIGGVIAGYITDNLYPTYANSLRVVTEEEYNNAFESEDIKPDSYAWGKNEIRVSNTGTTIFEVDKSYKIGHGEIIALARLSMGLSQDNYSKFPLVVFCTDGVYTLSVDASGQYAYHSQDPLSRAVCTNKNGICEIDGAVLFPTEFGLQMVTSDGVKPVALAAIGKPICSPDSVTIYNRAITNSQIVELKPNVSTTDFLSDIQDDNTYIKYLQAINSVIVYNKTKAYSYIINISDWTVTKIEHKILCDNGDYPKQTFFVDGNAINPVQFDYYSGKNNSMTLIASRPIMLETQHLKTGYRVVLRGVFEHNPVAQEEFYAAMCVFGSLDGEHWDFLNATEKKLTSNRFHDIGVETHHVSYKYLMVVLAGNLSKDCHIEGLEITSNVKYNNKLK